MFARRSVVAPAAPILETMNSRRDIAPAGLFYIPQSFYLFLKLPALHISPCARRRLHCRYPSESHRGLSNQRRTEIRLAEGVEAEASTQEEVAYHPDGRRKRKKGRRPTSWINAVDAFVIAPLAWARHQEEEANELVAKMAASKLSSCNVRSLHADEI